MCSVKLCTPETWNPGFLAYLPLWAAGLISRHILFLTFISPRHSFFPSLFSSPSIPLILKKANVHKTCRMLWCDTIRTQPAASPPIFSNISLRQTLIGLQRLSNPDRNKSQGKGRGCCRGRCSPNFPEREEN